MKILLTAFSGKTNSSKLLIDSIDTDCKLFLTNSFLSSGKQIIDTIKTIRPDFILAFGQKPKSNCIYIETQAHRENILQTNFDVAQLSESLSKNNISSELSDNAGNYLCNYVYYEGLKYITQDRLDTKMVFIHVPSMKEFINFGEMKFWLAEYMEGAQ